MRRSCLVRFLLRRSCWRTFLPSSFSLRSLLDSTSCSRIALLSGVYCLLFSATLVFLCVVNQFEPGQLLAAARRSPVVGFLLVQVAFVSLAFILPFGIKKRSVEDRLSVAAFFEWKFWIAIVLAMLRCFVFLMNKFGAE